MVPNYTSLRLALGRTLALPSQAAVCPPDLRQLIALP
jgi:hypothetical protein